MTGSGFRPEIQAMRAVAVALVVVFHLWPYALPGGYVGVDVFFVISGYLITSHLSGEAGRTGTIRLAAFWSRRIRRLLPAAAVVLVASLLLMLAVVPRPLWQQTVVEIGASAVSAQNWVLAANAVDYLAADGTPTLVQHFWSLSVEEQFYLVLPVLIVAVLALGRGRRVVTGMLGGVALASLVFSVLQAQEASGYFNTATRAWEFAAGGLLAHAPSFVARLRNHRRLAQAISWMGLALVGASAALLTSATPYPGIAALLPVGGTALVIAGGAEGMALGRAMGWRPVQAVGNLSYSIYLWHWPLTVVGGYVAVDSGWWPLVVVGITVVLAAATKRWVEDPGRALRGTRRTYGVATAAIAAILVLTTGTWGVVQGGMAASAQESLEHSRTDPCFGAAALVEQCADPFAMTPEVDTAFAAQDRGALALPCNSYGTTVKTCEFGDTEHYARTVAVVGNSHAAALIAGLDAYGRDHGWRVLLMRKTDCLGVSTLSLGQPGGQACVDWTRNVLAQLEQLDDLDLVLFGTHSNALHYLAASKPGAAVLDSLATEIRGTYQAVLARGVRVLVVGDTPGTKPTPAPECVYLHRGDDDPCATGRDDLDDGNIESTVARATPGVEYLSLQPYVCTRSGCHVLIGGLVVYFDDHHLSGTFSLSLAPYLGRALEG